MIVIVTRRRGRPAARPVLCVCDTAKEAVQVHLALREHGVRATWKPQAPYTLRVDAGRIAEARRILARWKESR